MKEAHQMEGSLHLIGQVITLHPTKQKKVCGTDIQCFIMHQFQNKLVLKRINQHEQRCKVKTSSFHPTPKSNKLTLAVE